MGRLILVRHAETKKNALGKLHMPGDHEGLSKKGRKQAKVLAKRLLDFKPQVVFTSNEKRAINTAEIIAKMLKVPYKVEPGLEERNWGDFTDRPWKDIVSVLDRMSLVERYLFVPPGGESWKAFEKRLIVNVEKLVSEKETIVIVTHGGAIRALMPYLLGVPREESFSFDLANASISMFDYNGKVFKKIIVNDISHLV